MTTQAIWERLNELRTAFELAGQKQVGHAVTLAAGGDIELKPEHLEAAQAYATCAGCLKIFADELAASPTPPESKAHTPPPA